MNLIYKNNLEIRLAKLEDIPFVADQMRESDRVEIWKSSNHTPEQALEQSFEMSSLCMTLLYKGKPIAMFGVAAKPDNQGIGCAWLLGTDDIKKIKRSFLELSKVVIRYMLEEYPVLFNFVDSDNHESIRWLKHCGAEFTDKDKLGVGHSLFKLFLLRRSNFV